MKQAMEETISDKMSRARRRQSDARWRASVASCYETLRLTIPVNKRATRRIAKVLILDFCIDIRKLFFVNTCLVIFKTFMVC